MSRNRNDSSMPGSGGGFFDWDEFQNNFFSGGGWKEAWNQNAKGTIPWVDRYIKGILADAVPGVVSRPPEEPGQPPAFSSKYSAITCNLFETHRSLIVRVRLSMDAEPKNTRIFVSPNEVNVIGLPGGEERTVKLPTPVRVDGAKAVCKNRIVEITLPKEEEVIAKEIPIRHMEGG